MSKAFTRDENEGQDLPDLRRPPSALEPGAQNYITRQGAERLRRELARLVEQERPGLHASAEDPDSKRRLFAVEQRIQQLEESLGHAVVIDPSDGPSDVVRFGATVTIREANGSEEVYHIVGVDEIDLEGDRISWQSPLARALVNARTGDQVHFESPAGPRALTIVSVRYGDPA